MLSENTIFRVLSNSVEFKLPFYFFLLKHFPFLRLKSRFRRIKPFPFFSKAVTTDRSPGIQRVSRHGPHSALSENSTTKNLHRCMTSFFSTARGSQLRNKTCTEKFSEHNPLLRGGFGTGTCNVPKHPAMEKCPEFQVLYLSSISTWALACRNGIHCSMDKFQELFPCAVNAKTGPSRLLLKCCCQAIKCLKNPELKEALCMYSPWCF